MIKQPISVVFDLDAKIGNSKLIAISHVEDKYNETLEVNVRQNGAHIDLTGATVFARMVLHKDRDYLLSDSVPCTVSDSGNVLIPFDNAVIPVQKGNIKIEVNLTQADSVLTLQFPLWVSVNGSILDNAEVTPESRGTVPDLLREAAEQLSRVKDFATEDFVFENLDAALQGNPHTSPSLFVMQDAETDNYKLVYMDSADDLHVLFDFGLLPVAKGEKGDKGDKGDKGEKGDKGDKGDKGATGAQGEKGEKGDKGDTGAQGVQGATGATGADGKSAYDVAVDNGFIGTERQWLNTLQGEKGEKGDKGDTGATGAQGEKGDKGDTGATGADGQDGFSPIAAVTKNGSTVTITITDKNGTTTKTVSDGAKGDKGDKGDTGATGPQGEKGDTGATGPQGPAGSNYVLTAADRQAIAQIAMDGLNGNGVAY